MHAQHAPRQVIKSLNAPRSNHAGSIGTALSMPTVLLFLPTSFVSQEVGDLLRLPGARLAAIAEEPARPWWPAVDRLATSKPAHRVGEGQLSMQPRLHSSRLRVKPSESSSSLTAGVTPGANAVAVMGIAYRCA